MPQLQEQATSGYGQMSSLWKLTRNPYFWNAIVLIAIGLLFLDANICEPEKQISPKAYIRGVRMYQKISHYALGGYVHCRFQPTCSNYSIEAVKKYGLMKGMTLTAKRLYSCRPSVPLNTVSPVP